MDADASGLMRVSKALVQDKGSSTNKQDVVASGGQSVFKKRSIARAIENLLFERLCFCHP